VTFRLLNHLHYRVPLTVQIMLQYSHICCRALITKRFIRFLSKGISFETCKFHVMEPLMVSYRLDHSWRYLHEKLFKITVLVKRMFFPDSFPTPDPNSIDRAHSVCSLSLVANHVCSSNKSSHYGSCDLYEPE
jgi:hypothetical protein